MKTLLGAMAIVLLLLPAGTTNVSAVDVATDQISIPNGEILGFSPDGEWLVASHPISASAGSLSTLRASLQAEEDDDEPKLCIYSFPSLAPRSCTAPGAYRGENGPRGVMDRITWSSDGDSLAFGDGSLRANVDGDIWQLETESGRLTNLTDDGFSGRIPLGEATEQPIYLDSDPAYSPDGASIAFVRTEIDSDGRAQPVVARLDIEMGVIESIAVLANDPFTLPVGRIIWSADGATIWFTTTGIGESTIGLWSASSDGSSADQITAPVADLNSEMLLLDVNLSGSYALVGLTRAFSRFTPPYFSLVDLTTGEIEPVAPSTSNGAISMYAVAFTPDGELLLAEQVAGDGVIEDTVRLSRRDPVSGQESLLAEGLPVLNFFPVGPGLTVLAGDLIAYPTDGDEETAPWVFVSLSGIDPIPATPETGGFQPGSTVVTTQDIALRTTPSATGALGLSLPAGTELIVIDAPVEIDGILWLPVREPDSSALGYIPASMVTSRSD